MRHPAIPWVAPFVVFMTALAVLPTLGLPPVVDLVIRIALPVGVWAALSRRLFPWTFVKPFQSGLVGIAVFVIWIGPDHLLPGWRQHWLFQNSLTGPLAVSLTAESLRDPLQLTLRVFRAVAVVPVVEELFWRGWLSRWIADHHFERVPLGAFTTFSFCVSALLFGAEHGPFWDVGILAGAVYNWWMSRTRSLADLVLTHAVTNACLAAFVMVTSRWEYWL